MTTRKQLKSRPRIRIQRAFVAWFRESRKRLKLPFGIRERNKKYIVLDCVRSGLKVQALLNSRGLHVSLYWQDGVQCDVLWNEAVTQLGGDGYECMQSIDPELWGPDVHRHATIRPYPRREDVWRVHLFEVFLDYVNNELTRYPWIEIYEIPGRSFDNDTRVHMAASHGVGLLNAREDTLQNQIVSQLVLPADRDNEARPADAELELPFCPAEKEQHRHVIPSPLYIS